jgi:hypothetical protein
MSFYEQTSNHFFVLLRTTVQKIGPSGLALGLSTTTENAPEP